MSKWKQKQKKLRTNIRNKTFTILLNGGGFFMEICKERVSVRRACLFGFLKNNINLSKINKNILQFDLKGDMV